MQALSITAAIPTYRRPREFRRALESVLGQTEGPDRIIVGDDGSQDEIREICESYGDARIVYVARRSKLRMTENWDFVMRWASGGLVALLEDDNFWYPDHLKRAKELLRRFPAAGMYHAGHQEAWDNGEELDLYKTYFAPWHDASGKGAVVSTKDIVFDALVCGSINSSTVVVRREALDGVPLFDHRYLMGMDTLMWTRLAMAHGCVYGPHIDTVYTYHGRNVSASEVSSRRAGFQVRGSRRLIAAEALAADIVSEAEFERFLRDTPADQLAPVFTMLAHPETDPRLRAIARRVWSARRDLRNASGYLRAAALIGFGVLAQADRIDRVLGRLARTFVPRRPASLHPGAQ